VRKEQKALAIRAANRSLNLQPKKGSASRGIEKKKGAAAREKRDGDPPYEREKKKKCGSNSPWLFKGGKKKEPSERRLQAEEKRVTSFSCFLMGGGPSAMRDGEHRKGKKGGGLHAMHVNDDRREEKA